MQRDILLLTEMIDLGVLHTTAGEQLPDFTGELRQVLRSLQNEA